MTNCAPSGAFLSMGRWKKENRDLRQRVKQYQSILEQHDLAHLFGETKRPTAIKGGTLTTFVDD